MLAWSDKKVPIKALEPMAGMLRCRRSRNTRRVATRVQLVGRRHFTGLMGVSIFANMTMKNWTILYYDERVKRDVFALPKGILASYLRLIETMEEHGADLRMPHSRAMGAGLFELRPRGREGIGRVFYCVQVRYELVILHSFVKKTQETPEDELRIARRRMKEVQSNG